MEKRGVVLCRILMFIAVVVLLVVTSLGQRGVTKDKMRQDRCEFNWGKFLPALEKADTPDHILERSGPAVLQISRAGLRNVNEYYNTTFTMSEVEGSRHLARWCCVLYFRLWGADEDYERAVMVWAIGPKGLDEEEARRYWREDVRPALVVQGLLR